MKVVHQNKGLPRVWRHHLKMTGLLAEHDISIDRSRLKAKLLVFDGSASMQKSWNAIMPNKICRNTLGAVNGLACEVVSFSGDREISRTEVDPRYFCVMALSAKDLCFEVIAHESVHAGFCYAKRTRSKSHWAKAFDFDEEHVCYPAGRIARAINIFCDKRGLYKLSKRIRQS